MSDENIENVFFSDEETQEAFDYLFDKLIPRIQQHVDETNHIWNLVTTCHECLTVRQAYQSNISFIRANILEKNGVSINNIFQSIADEQVFNSCFNRKLSD